MTDRTIRSWEKVPAFGLYQRRLEREEEMRRGNQRRMKSAQFTAQLTEAKEKAQKSALEVVGRAMESGDIKVAIEFLKLRL